MESHPARVRFRFARSDEPIFCLVKADSALDPEQDLLLVADPA
jgi:hypothetical protein